MKRPGPSISPTKMHWQRVASFVAIGSFFLTAAILYSLDRWLWHHFVAPHVALVSCVPNEGEILGQRVDELGTGVNACAYPRAVYQYEVNGQSFENSVIRHPNYTRSNAEEGNVGEVRFYGTDRQQQAEAFLKQYPTGKKVSVWVNPSQPGDAMLIRQELDISPFMLGLIPGIFVPFLWMFLVLALHTFVGSPEARWAALGWGILSLASLAPLFWQYQQLLGSAGADHFARLQNVGLGLAAVIVIASLAPGLIRSAMAIRLILCFTFVGGAGHGRRCGHWSIPRNAGWDCGTGRCIHTVDGMGPGERNGRWPAPGTRRLPGIRHDSALERFVRFWGPGMKGDSVASESWGSTAQNTMARTSQ